VVESITDRNKMSMSSLDMGDDEADSKTGGDGVAISLDVSPSSSDIHRGGDVAASSCTTSSSEDAASISRSGQEIGDVAASRYVMAVVTTDGAERDGEIHSASHGNVVIVDGSGNNQWRDKTQRPAQQATRCRGRRETNRACCRPLATRRRLTTDDEIKFSVSKGAHTSVRSTGPATMPAAFKRPRPGYRRKLLRISAITDVSEHVLNNVYRNKKTRMNNNIN